MTQIELADKRRLAMKIAQHNGYPGHAEDFAQEAIMELARGRKASLDLLFFDYLRKTFGRCQQDRVTPEMEARRTLESKWVEVSKFKDSLFAPTADHDVDFQSILRLADAEDRPYLVLCHKWDLTLKEIGDVFGVSESRACQLLGEAYKRLGRRMKADKRNYVNSQGNT